MLTFFAGVVFILVKYGLAHNKSRVSLNHDVTGCESVVRVGAVF